MILGIIGSLIGLTFSVLRKPSYTAELTFVLEAGKSSGAMGSYLGIASQFGIDIGGNDEGGVFEGENLLAFMKSRAMIRKALLASVEVKGKKQTLAELYISVKKLREQWTKKNSKFKNIYFPTGMDSEKLSVDQNIVFESFYNQIITDCLLVEKADKKTSIISLTVISENELFSKFFAEILATEVSNFYVETKTKKAVENLNILQYQTDSVKRAFNMAINGVASLTDQNPNPNPARQILRVPSQSRQLDVQVNQTLLAQLIQNLELAKVSLRKETPLIQIIDTPLLPLPRSNITWVQGVVIGGVLGIIIGLISISVIRFFKIVMS